jgi:HlyD family secretion protein
MAKNASLPKPADPRQVIRRLNLAGFATLALFVGGIGGWAATSEISGAVIAPGTLVVESSVRKVQHPTGGIVGTLLVEEGSAVEAGQVLLTLDDTLPRTTLGVVEADLGTQLAREARLIAERDGTPDLVPPAPLGGRTTEASLARALAGEQKLFEARRATLVGQRDQLREQVAQLNEQVAGLQAQRAAKDSQIQLTDDELVGVAALYQQRLTSTDRLTTLQRNKASLEGERGQLVAAIAGARGKISETELQILQLDKDFQTGVLNDLRDAEAKISGLRERQIAAEDQLRRIEIRSPSAGTVHELAVHTIGGIIGPGDTIMLIVPRADKLVVDAKVAPNDVDQVGLGAKVSVRILAGNRRTVPVRSATVTRVSPDLVQDNANTRPYYLVRMALTEESTSPGDLVLLAGMPVEAFVETDKRSPLSYLVEPLREQIARTFRER